MPADHELAFSRTRGLLKAEADLVVEGTYAMGRPTPAYMEPNVCVCRWDDDRLTVWISTQTPFMVRGSLADLACQRLAFLVVHIGERLCDHREEHVLHPIGDIDVGLVPGIARHADGVARPGGGGA